MALTREMILQAIGPHTVSAADARRVLEIACLAVAADGHLANEEAAVIHVLCTELAIDPRGIDEILALATRDDRLDRLRAAGGALSSEAAKHLAYRVTVLTALADLASADEEFEFDLDVQDALQLSGADADRLAGAVHEALTPDAG